MLGYQSTREQAAARIHAVAATDGVAFVADAGDRLEGFAHVEVRVFLQTDQFAEVSSIVVDESSRGRGIGAKLLACAETWASERGLVS